MQPTKQKLSEKQIHDLLTELPEWALEDGKLARNWTLPTFVEAIAFVNRVARIAQEAQHHPDIDIRYNLVRLALVSHAAGGITERDIRMARQLSAAFPSSAP